MLNIGTYYNVVLPAEASNRFLVSAAEVVAIVVAIEVRSLESRVASMDPSDVEMGDLEKPWNKIWLL